MILWGGSLLAGIFFVDGVLGVLLIIGGVVIGLLELVFTEVRVYQEYKERSGAASPGERGA